ncbi:tRNA-uridine aminocarboxypropyltransferase [Paraglaciecola arctica]|uniref:tRNA-uridine aminocarboxypropyltransferase n=1 Tax=Paraglaciecola arctica TaxID=1128911 RepID=UPI001C0770F9|nr:tRNA-uridine aminocarboxypropyltransferase [Paraglaciecola arctica]MBU3003438.1 DTW domain-containing protein [Paraglaciecola arctica]
MADLKNTKRLICADCGYPQATCLCPWVKPIDSPMNIVILQHPSEAKHAKNTVRLLALGLSNVKILQGETAADFSELAEVVLRSQQHYHLCYPHAKSIAIETFNTQIQPIEFGHTLILIDASWRKALKMWHLNPWLHSLNSWHFANPPKNQYQIRHTTQKNSLSTLESVSYVLELIHDLDCSPLYLLFNQMQIRCFINQKRK